MGRFLRFVLLLVLLVLAVAAAYVVIVDIPSPRRELVHEVPQDVLLQND